jgi:hypothetical protein
MDVYARNEEGAIALSDAVALFTTDIRTRMTPTQVYTHLCSIKNIIVRYSFDERLTWLDILCHLHQNYYDPWTFSWVQVFIRQDCINGNF